MVKSLVSKLSSASNLSLASTLSAVNGSAQETNYLKHRNDPGRFFGDGVQFKAKLIGILEVGEARGDRMCQEALQDLKMAIRAAGEHKQRITIHVTLDGLRLRDEKTGDSLYHHPVHKISFIAQDMTDSRAFGYIFGSPDSGHRFFGIKTDKAASQVVLAMRDLFQVVFELKKKEIELARQQIQSKAISDQLASLSSLKSSGGGQNDLASGGGATGAGTGSLAAASSSSLMGNNLSSSARLGGNFESKLGSSKNAKEMSPESVADLVDLEQELSSIQRGITQMERITPNETGANATVTGRSSVKEEDPFGDSFTKFPTYNLLPPPESGRSRSKPNKPNEMSGSSGATISAILSPAPVHRTSPINAAQEADDNWLSELDQQADVFDTTKRSGGLGMGMVTMPMAPLAVSESTSTPTQQLSEHSAIAEAEVSLSAVGAVAIETAVDSVSNETDQMQQQAAAAAAAAAIKSDAFTDLDPLGTGRTRPYVDKKYFFHELKNPPKKVLKDLSSQNQTQTQAKPPPPPTSPQPQAQTQPGVDLLGSNYTTASAVVDEFLSKEGLFDDTITVTTTGVSVVSVGGGGGGGSGGSMHGSMMDQHHPHQHQSQQSQSQPPQQQQQQQKQSQQNSLASLAYRGGADSIGSSGSADDPVMLPRDTDPFSPTRKKSDPFQEGDLLSKLDPFEFSLKPKVTATRVSPSTATASTNTMTGANDTSVGVSGAASAAAAPSADVFNGPLQVSLPPEIPWHHDISHLEKRPSEKVHTDASTNTNPARSRPTIVGQLSTSIVGYTPSTSSVFKHQTAEVISSISSKKMPHLFGQARFSKRDSNTINMRRLQESDSLSENETAPEPPPRPDSVSHAEPPPLPPKKQLTEIVIRPRVTSGNVVSPTHFNSGGLSSSNRYEYLTSIVKAQTMTTSSKQAVGGGISSGGGSGGGGDVPPIPLPSRRIGRSEGVYPGPGRPRKPGHTEDDYLAPICGSGGTTAIGGDVPPLLPPPVQSSTRGRSQRQHSAAKAQEIYENKSEILQQQQQQEQQRKQMQTDETGSGGILPDITLSQLLTLGIDELATKLNVPTSKLSTMTLIELTSYLAEFLEKSKPPASTATPEPKAPSHTIFKTTFDHQGVFVAKFDDTFGEDLPNTASGQQPQEAESFVANFDQFNEPPVAPAPLSGANRRTSVPPADRYAVFREIIDQELLSQQKNKDGDDDFQDDGGRRAEREQLEALGIQEGQCLSGDLLGEVDSKMPAVPAKIDTKITEVVAQAKDRYAALRDIILVENLFEKKDHVLDMITPENPEFPEYGDELNEDQDLKQIMDHHAEHAFSGAGRAGLVDSRGFPAEPSSSALTIEDDDDDDDEEEEEEDDDGGVESSGDSNDKDAEGTGEEKSLPQDQYEKLSTSTLHLDVDRFDKIEVNEATEPSSLASNLGNFKQDGKLLTVSGTSPGLSSSKDDLEIDELMQRAISNLSLDSRDRISPANSTNVVAQATASSSAALARSNEARLSILTAQTHKYSDVSTSPIPLQKSPTSRLTPQQKSPLSKSPQASPVSSQLSAVSNLIEKASKEINGSTGPDAVLSLPVMKASGGGKQSWATFDTPVDKKRSSRGGGSKTATAANKSSSLHLPPPPPFPSNASQNDTIESPCSSDTRDEGWAADKAVSRTAGGGRRWQHKADRHQTSSSSRDLSPWDDEAPNYHKHKRIPESAGQSGPLHGGVHADRHGYYMRHARRMNSCDEDYDYDEDVPSRRDHRKFKQGISRSRDNFDLDSPSWFYHPSHQTWSPQDIEQSRARSFDRNTYERSTYGPPLYDKRGIAFPPGGPGPGPASGSVYDRRTCTYEGKRKNYRDYARPNYDIDEYGGGSPSMPDRYRDSGSFEKMKAGRRSDYENVYDDGRSPGGYKIRAEYFYDRDRKSFDRDSIESYESATRRRRSFGSGDVYGSLESREEFRERYTGGGIGGPEKTRSLRKSAKLRATGDIDFEQDSESDFVQQRSHGNQIVVDARSLQRPGPARSVAASSSMSITSAPSRMRKSSGSSPWDGEEQSLPGQKSWKRSTNSADAERRLAESRRTAAMGHVPSESDGEKEHRSRKKQRSRSKDCVPSSGGRYTAHPRDKYEYIAYDDNEDDIDDDDYVDEEYDEPPTDEDKFERLKRRQHEMHQRIFVDSERRQDAAIGGRGPSTAAAAAAAAAATAAKKYPISDRGAVSGGGLSGGKYGFDDYERTPSPRSSTNVSTHDVVSSGGGGGGGSGGVATSNSKFSFDGGFESDFNQSSPPPPTTSVYTGTAPSSCTSTPAALDTVSAMSTTPHTASIGKQSAKSAFRFSNDFSDRDKMPTYGPNANNSLASSSHEFETTTTTTTATAGAAPTNNDTPPITQRLRFDDNVKVSQFEDATAFEDDFSSLQFDFEKQDKWQQMQPSAGASAVTTAVSVAPNNGQLAKKQNVRNNKLHQRQELIKKSESINIFAKKSDDPFEDDDFFKGPPTTKANSTLVSSTTGPATGNGSTTNNNNGSNSFQWDDDSNFAKFDENM